MVKNKDRWSALSMKDRADLIKLYVESGITDLGEIRKSYNGIPYRDFNTSEYDYFNAHPDNAPTKEGEHWTSRNPHTGRLLKREDHPTFDLMIEGEKQVGYKVIKGYNDELYSVPNEPTNYVEDYNSFGDGGRILEGTEEEQTLSGKKPTLEEFIQAKADSTRNAALEKSYTRVKGIEIPYEFGEHEKSLVQRTLEYSAPYARFTHGPYTKNEKDDIKTINYYLGQYYQAKKELEDNCKYGFNCIGTATDNYPKESRTVSNRDFDENFEKYGFQYVGMKNAKPGDIAKTPEHAMIYVGTDANGNPLFNYSDGGITEYNYKKDARYPASYYGVYTYVGTPELIQQWTGEYEDTYNKKYGGKLNKFKTGGPIGEGTATYNHPKYNHKEEAAIYSYLRERGVPHTQTSAIMGNIAVESMLDPNISQIGGGGGYGLIQATDQPRKNNFINYDGQIYEFGSELDPETQRQLDYIIDKGLNDYTIGEWRKVGKSGARNVRKEFLKESDIIKASDLFTKGYLRPGKPHTKRRQSMSRYFNDNYGEVERQLKSFSDTFLFK